MSHDTWQLLPELTNADQLRALCSGGLNSRLGIETKLFHRYPLYSVDDHSLLKQTFSRLAYVF